MNASHVLSVARRFDSRTARVLEELARALESGDRRWQEQVWARVGAEAREALRGGCRATVV